MKDELVQIGGKSYKQCKVVMLSTKEKSNLRQYPTGKLFFTNLGDYHEDCKNQHLYILSSEEIKEGEWKYDIVTKKIEKSDYTGVFRDWKKIIATTDESLVVEEKCWCMKPEAGGCHQCNKSLPKSSDDFIKAFVKAQGKIDKVLVEYEQEKSVGYTQDRQRTFYGSFKLKIAPDNTITIKPIQEKKTSWSRKEVIELCKKAMVNDEHYDGFRQYMFNKWIEENLK